MTWDRVIPVETTRMASFLPGAGASRSCLLAAGGRRDIGSPSFSSHPGVPMALSWLDLVGSVAGTLTTVAFVPQVVKTWRSRSTRDISLAMWLAFSLGVALWMLYGLLAGSVPIVVSNGLTLLLAGSVLRIKLANRGKE